MNGTELFPGHFAPMGVGVIPREELVRSRGLDLLRRMIAGELPAPPIAAVLNFTLTEADAGRVVFRGLPGEHHLNPVGTVHGGWTATVMDSALACAVMTTLEPGEAHTTAEFKVNLVRPITPRTGEVVCEGRVVHRGRTLAISEASLKDGGGKLLAFGTETCSIFAIAGASDG